MSYDASNKGPTIQGGTIYPTELPPRPTGPSRNDRRMCPGYRSCVPGLVLASYSLKTNGDKELFARRLCMIIILVLRTVNTVLFIVHDTLTIKIFNAIIGVIFFLFVAHWLHLIGSMTGTRRVLGLNINRWHYDAFLFAEVLAHVAVCILTMLGDGSFGWIMDGCWLALGLLIFGAAWISTWDPEPASVV